MTLAVAKALFGEQWATWMAEGSKEVDTIYSPLKFWNSDYQGWHFNTNIDDPNKEDSRTINARNSIASGLEYYKQRKYELAFKEFGHALHAQQDMIAHTANEHRKFILGGYFHWGGVDNPTAYVYNDGYTAMKGTTSKMYTMISCLSIYIYITLIDLQNVLS